MKPFKDYPKNIQKTITKIESIFINNKPISESDFIITLAFVLNKYKNIKKVKAK